MKKISLLTLLLSIIIPTVSFSTTEIHDFNIKSELSQEIEVQYSSHVQDFG